MGLGFRRTKLIVLLKFNYNNMRSRRFLLLVLFIALICSCKKTTFYYKIPVVDRVMTIYSPLFRDYAYVCVGTSKSLELDSMDFKITKGETTEVSLIFSKQKCDTIYYSDRWNDASLMNRKKRYKKIKWYDDRFYFKEKKRYVIRPNYIEIVIKDDATFVVYQLNKSYLILKPI